MRNIKLTIEYDGTNYVGWQRQLNGKSIQGEIELALKKILQEDITIIGAGRTDAGVHARGQVANFRTNSILSPTKIKPALNSTLNDDIVIHHVEEVAEDFHSRFSAKERVYLYYISFEPTALERYTTWHLYQSLDVALLHEAATVVLGSHDFEAFAKVGSDVKHHVCNVFSSQWMQAGDRLVYTISADRFLRGMVRALVGTMVDVGRGFIRNEDFIERLEKKLKYEPRTAAPACGLVLERVLY